VNGNYNSKGAGSNSGDGLETAVKLWPTAKTSGQLNADWTERLMGYPDGWTDVDKADIDRAEKYPQAWLDGSWDTIPRTVVKQECRRQRIKGLGNAVVPQVTAYLWGLIKKALEEKE
jgi:hypothetical protein